MSKKKIEPKSKSPTKKNKPTTEDVISLVNALCKEQLVKINELSIRANRLEPKIADIEERLGFLDKQNAFREGIDEKIKGINIAIAQLLGRIKLCNLKIDSQTHLRKLAEIEKRLAALEEKPT